ncbi:MAG: Crp/Fnr family transcriptional regulator [Lutibacter sp.]
MLSNYKKHSSNIFNFKQKKSIAYNLNLIIKNKLTSHLINVIYFKEGELLIKQNEKTEGIFFIVKGNAKAYNTGKKRTNILRFVSVGDIVGLSSLNFESYWSNVQAIENVKAYFINIKNLIFILKNNSKLSLLLINYLSLKLQYFEIRQKHLSVFQTKERIYESLLVISNFYGICEENKVVINVNISRSDIAYFSNTTYENTLRTLKKLEIEKVISFKNKIIIILNSEFLLNSLKKSCCDMKNLTESDLCYINALY